MEITGTTKQLSGEWTIKKGHTTSSCSSCSICMNRDYKTSEYIKTIGIKIDKFSLIDKIRGKKSKAGKLDEIIEFYIKEKKL